MGESKDKDWRTKKISHQDPLIPRTWKSIAIPPDEYEYLEKVQLVYQTYEGQPVPRYQVLVTGLRLLEKELEKKLRLNGRAGGRR